MINKEELEKFLNSFNEEDLKVGYVYQLENLNKYFIYLGEKFYQDVKKTKQLPFFLQAIHCLLHSVRRTLECFILIEEVVDKFFLRIIFNFNLRLKLYNSLFNYIIIKLNS